MKNKPNILVFLVDQMQSQVTRDDHPCIMPNVKKFAKDGIRFDSTYTPSPHCCPSRATFMTGLYPTRHGVFNNVNTITAHQYGLNPGIRTYACFLKSAGYTTAYSGKTHVSNNQSLKDLGWDMYPNEELYTFWASTRALPGNTIPDKREHGQFLRYNWWEQEAYGEVDSDPEALKKNKWYPHVIDGIEKLKKLAKEKDPWHLVISTDMDHHNAVPKDIYDMYDPSMVTIPDSFNDEMKDKPRIYNRIRQQNWGQLTEDEIREDILRYWCLCTLQDKYFGMILDALKGSGQEENTLVLFLSDHGDYVYAHGLCNMGIPSFSEAYHVPAIMRWPKGIKDTGRTISEFITLADFAPTFLDLAGEKADQHFTGKSLMPFIDGNEPSKWRDCVCHQTNGNESYFTQRIVMTKKWRYVLNWFDYDELYDLESDPHQMNNILFEYYNQSAFVKPMEKAKGPWPLLPENLDAVRKDLIKKIWEFALDEEDTIFNGYFTAAVSPYGPGITGRKGNTMRTKERLLKEGSQ
ncbi:sulfatase-like hydrolase/transferase [Spirochaetota bacterium]